MFILRKLSETVTDINGQVCLSMNGFSKICIYIMVYYKKDKSPVFNSYVP